LCHAQRLAQRSLYAKHCGLTADLPRRVRAQRVNAACRAETK
jgi:hypothetical protein